MNKKTSITLICIFLLLINIPFVFSGVNKPATSWYYNEDDEGTDMEGATYIDVAGVTYRRNPQEDYRLEKPTDGGGWDQVTDQYAEHNIIVTAVPKYDALVANSYTYSVPAGTGGDNPIGLDGIPESADDRSAFGIINGRLVEYRIAGDDSGTAYIYDEFYERNENDIGDIEDELGIYQNQYERAIVSGDYDAALNSATNPVMAKYAAGLKAMSEGDYEDAVSNFEAAHDFTTDPSIRFDITVNTAEAQFANGDLSESRANFESVMLNDELRNTYIYALDNPEIADTALFALDSFMREYEELEEGYLDQHPEIGRSISSGAYRVPGEDLDVAAIYEDVKKEFEERDITKEDRDDVYRGEESNYAIALRSMLREDAVTDVSTAGPTGQEAPAPPEGYDEEIWDQLSEEEQEALVEYIKAGKELDNARSELDKLGKEDSGYEDAKNRVEEAMNKVLKLADGEGGLAATRYSLINFNLINSNINTINSNTGLDLSPKDFKNREVPSPGEFDFSYLTDEALKEKVSDSDYATYIGSQFGIPSLRKDDLKDNQKDNFDNRELELNNLEDQLKEGSYNRYRDNFIDTVERWTGSSDPFDNREDALEAFNTGDFDPKKHLKDEDYENLKINLNSYFITAEGDLSLDDEQIKKAFNALQKGEKLDDEKLKELLGDDYEEFTSYSYWGSFNSLSELFEALSFRGISGIYSTINSDYADHVEERLRGWNEKYCTNVAGGILGGKQCVFSFLCRSFGYEPGDDGTSGSDAFVELPSGMIRPTGSVQAERSSKITLQDPPVYLYKITFYVKAMYEDVEFNVFLYESGNKGPKLFTGSNVLLEGKEDGNGDIYSARGEFAAVNYHPKRFDRVCIEFYKGPHSGKKICNKITVSDYSRANYINSGADSGNQQQNVPGNDPYADSQNQQINLNWD
ncbi:hypothetical protein GF361_05355 [Candidatus Woesearchaeota archaeon]|nr:hypothetical protein [Candidatus Woesearchaeota archaeon]